VVWAAKAAVAKAVDALGGLDVLVNNAGYGDIGPFEQVSSERFRALFETNFFGVVSMTRAAIGACVSNAQQKNSNQPRDCCSKLLIIRRGEVAEWLKAAVC
jgi:NAD(P)-dependent dehydrogenase (short-subunit alcohol dehydrogenase family)